MCLSFAQFSLARTQKLPSADATISDMDLPHRTSGYPSVISTEHPARLADIRDN